MADQVEIKGLDDVRKALLKLPKQMRKRALDQALRKGGNIVRDVARDLVPVDTGLTRDSIVVRSEKKRYLLDAARLKVGVATKRPKKGEKSNTPYYWRFIEFGYVRKDGTHIPARPFLSKAFEFSQLAAFNAIKQHLAKSLPRLIRQARR